MMETSSQKEVLVRSANVCSSSRSSIFYSTLQHRHLKCSCKSLWTPGKTIESRHCVVDDNAETKEQRFQICFKMFHDLCQDTKQGGIKDIVQRKVVSNGVLL